MNPWIKSIAALVLGLVLLVASQAHAQAFPAKPIRMLVGFPAGGGADGMARLTATHLAEALAAQGAKVTPGSAEQLGAFIASEVRKWGAVARESGAKAQ